MDKLPLTKTYSIVLSQYTRPYIRLLTILCTSAHEQHGQAGSVRMIKIENHKASTCLYRVLQEHCVTVGIDDKALVARDKLTDVRRRPSGQFGRR